MNFSLAVGTQPQQLTVSGDVNKIDSTTSTVGGLIAEQSLTELPFNSRDLFKAAILAPGVAPTPSSAPSLLSNGDASQVSMSGMRPSCLCRLLLAPAAIGIFSTLFCESFLACPVRYPGAPIECMRLLPSPMSSAFPLGRLGRLPAFVHVATSRGNDFEAADIPLCSGQQVCSPPRLLPPLRLCRRAAEAYTSGQNVLRCLRTHRIS